MQHRGVADLPITKICTFYPALIAAVIQVSLTLLLVPLEHIAPDTFYLYWEDIGKRVQIRQH